MSNGSSWSWIKDTFTNKLVVLCIVLIVILAPYFIAADRTLKITILIGVGIIIIVAILLQFADQRALKSAEKKIIQQVEDKEKDLLKKYIKWNEKIKGLFDNFLVTGILYYEILDNNHLTIRTHLERNVNDGRGKIRKYTHIYTVETNQEITNADYLAKEGVVKKIKSKEGEPFTFKLALTKDGKNLLENIRKIKDLSQ